MPDIYVIVIRADPGTYDSGKAFSILTKLMLQLREEEIGATLQKVNY